MELAFIGTGMMGRPMIDNLLADGDTVTVWNRTAEHARPRGPNGARPWPARRPKPAPASAWS